MADLTKKAFWIGSGDVFARGVAFAASIYLARTLGAELFGLLTVSIAVIGYATWFADLGLLNLGTREAARSADKRIFRIKEIVYLKFLLGISVWITSSLIIWYLPLDEVNRNIILIYLISLIPYSLMTEWILNGKQEYDKVALSKILNSLVYVGFIFLIVRSTEDIYVVPVIYTIAVSVASVTLGVFSIRSGDINKPARGSGIYRDLLKSSVVLGLGWFFAQIVQLLPPLLIGIFFSLEQTGYYGAAFRFVIVGMMLDRVFVNLLLPNISSSWFSNRENTIQQLKKVFRLIMTGGMCISLVTFIEAENIIDLAYGESYLPAVPILKWLSVFIGITFINSLFSFTLIASNNDRKYFIATAISGCISAGLIGVMSYYGTVEWVAVSVVLSEVVITIFTYLQFRKICDIDLLKPLLGGIMLITMIILLSGLIEIKFVEGILSIPLFIGLAMAFQIIRTDDLKWIRDKF